MKNKHFTFFLLFLLLTSFHTSFTEAQEYSSPNNPGLFHVGVVLDLDSVVGKVAQRCISMALSDYYAVHPNYNSKIVLHVRDSRGDAINAASAALYLMKDVEVQALIWPQQSTQASFAIDLGEKAQVPIVSFSATSPSLSPLKSPYFVRTAIDDSTQVQAIAAMIQAFQWKEVVLIHEDTDYGNVLIPYFLDVFEKIDVHIPYRSTIPLDATDDQILTELHNLTTMQTSVFIVHMSSAIGSRLFINANNAGMMSKGYAWIVTDGFSSLFQPMDSKTISSMEGVLGVRPYIPKSKELEEFDLKWRRMVYLNKSSSELSEPGLYGLWAYDTVWTLAMAVERVGTLDPQFLSSNTTNNLTNLSSLGYSPIGPKLLQSILNTTFRGLSGDFHLVNGQLKSFAFQIFNVIGEGERVIGYWTKTGGLSMQLNTTNKLTNSDSVIKLKLIVWPGYTTTKPKGWIIPTNGEEYLKVLVPIKYGFKEFVSMERDPVTKKMVNITGFCIEVFQNITSKLSFGLRYEYQPYPLDGEVIQNYTELIDQVYHKKFDAVVGDVSILAKRANYVDFTMPFSESGVIMVVPMTDNFERETWMFVKPLSPYLWLVTFGGFFYIGFVIWTLERHRHNSDFAPTIREGIPTSLWYSFLTLIFSQREKIDNNLTRFVLITWVFYMLILTQSYTASLSSSLTVRQLQPTIKNIHEIRSNGYYVGYQDGSFVGEFLTDYLLLDKSKLKPYTTPEDYHNALSNGSVVAIFDEIPYVQVFLNTYCNKYSTVGLTYSSEGLGFVFPKDSRLVSYLSTEILKITDDGTLDKIKQRWLQTGSNCDGPSSSSRSTTQLTLRSFVGLYIIIGVVSISSLLINFMCRGCPVQIPSISQMLRWIAPPSGLNYFMPFVPQVPVVELQPGGTGACAGAEHVVINIVERVCDPENRGAEETIEGEPSNPRDVGSTSTTQAPIQLENTVGEGPSATWDVESTSRPRTLLDLGSLRCRAKNLWGEDPDNSDPASKAILKASSSRI
ncbi:hypothetical protein NE237_025358 [Protea cynaroides]|uniref:Ionotropic glutamate receptor C-terminal domain-containing protein n=1 Tax=Protea cynaroides TaxID=273540 RepID=A0A9Q0K0H0_9MAGN|nr:hypothetical protein NE237_025358 [Protea cynaroides]